MMWCDWGQQYTSLLHIHILIYIYSFRFSTGPAHGPALFGLARWFFGRPARFADLTPTGFPLLLSIHTTKSFRKNVKTLRIFEEKKYSFLFSKKTFLANFAGVASVKKISGIKADVRKVLMSLVRTVDGRNSDGSSRVQFAVSSYGHTSVIIGTAIESHTPSFNNCTLSVLN